MVFILIITYLANTEGFYYLQTKQKKNLFLEIGGKPD